MYKQINIYRQSKSFMHNLASDYETVDMST